MYCGKCGNQINDTDTRCSVCGASIEPSLKRQQFLQTYRIMREAGINNSRKRKLVVLIVAGVIVVALLVVGVLFADEISDRFSSGKGKSHKDDSEEKTYVDEEKENNDIKDTKQREYKGEVYITSFGKKYHLYKDCKNLNNSDASEVYSVESPEIAIQYGCSGVCKACEARFNSLSQ